MQGPVEPVASSSKHVIEMDTSDADSKRRQAIVDKVVRRAEISRTARNLKQRLSLAAYKAQHGVASSKLEDLEPKLEQDYQAALARKRRAEHEMSVSPPSKRVHTEEITRLSFDDSLPAYPPQMSLYDAMMTPNMSVLQDTFASPKMIQRSSGRFADDDHGRPPPLRISTDLDKAASRGHSNHHLQGNLHYPTSPISSTNGDSPPALNSSTRKSRRTESLPGRLHTDLNPRNSPFSPLALHQEIKPLSTSDPTFVKSAPEFVAAANALTSFSRGPSEDALTAHAPNSQDGQPTPLKLTPRAEASRTANRSGGKTKPGLEAQNAKPSLKRSNPSEDRESGHSADANGESDRESAAELMLYLATSPSPASSQYPTSPKRTSADPPLIAMKGRQLLFGEMFSERDLQSLQATGSPSRSAPAHISSFSQSAAHQSPFGHSRLANGTIRRDRPPPEPVGVVPQLSPHRPAW